MAFVRVKRHGERDYYHLVETYREAGKVKQRGMRYIGTRPQRDGGSQEELLSVSTPVDILHKGVDKRSAGARLVIINKGKTPLDRLAHLRFHERGD